MSCKYTLASCADVDHNLLTILQHSNICKHLGDFRKLRNLHLWCKGEVEYEHLPECYDRDRCDVKWVSRELAKHKQGVQYDRITFHIEDANLPQGGRARDGKTYRAMVINLVRKGEWVPCTDKMRVFKAEMSQETNNSTTVITRLVERLDYWLKV